jgi:hypothetical protein
MFERHLSDDVLILLVGGQLADASRQATANHLQRCADCRRRYEETRSVHATWVAVSEYGLANILRSKAQQKRKPAKAEIRFPWAPVSAVLATSLAVILFVSLPKVVPEARAGELLDHAIQNEGSQDSLRTFQVSVQGTKCGMGRGDEKLILAQTSTLCTQATSLIEKTPWRSRALSARTFHDWHDSLSERHDTVTKESSAWMIDTVTPMGIVREASLALRLTDYRPLSLQLKFENEQQITITEGTQPLLYAKSMELKDSLPGKAIDNPADLLEVHAWEVLRSLNADSGWEANVLRDGNRVLVKASVPSETRKQEIADAFHSYPDVDLDIHEYHESSETNDFLAQRTLDGDAPALALDWLKQQFPDPESRNRYANDTVDLSKAVLGRAFVLEQLQSRQHDLRQCSCAAELAKLIERQTILLNIAEKDLNSATSSLIGDAKRKSSKPLSYEDAKRLDWALGNLLIASSSQSPISYDESMETVRRLL